MIFKPIRRSSPGSHFWRLSGILCLILVPFLLIAQDFRINLAYKEFNKSNGFDAGYILAFHQDSLGFMWVGSDIGLHRFDGNEMKPYLTSLQINDSKVPLQISAILEDEQGIFWLGLRKCKEASLLKFNPRTNHIESFNIYPDSIPQERRWINNIFQFDEIRLWLATDTGLICFNKEDNTASAILRPSQSDLTFIDHLGNFDADRIQFGEMLIDPGGEGFWCGTSMGLYLFSPETNQFIGYVPEDITIEDTRSVVGRWLNTSFAYDHAGILWTAINGYLYRFDLEKRVFDPVYKRIKNYERRPDQGVVPSFDPRFPDRLIFLTTYTGVLIIDTRDLTSYRILDQKDPKRNLKAISYFHTFDAFGNLWVGSQDSEGIVVVSNLNTPFHAVWDIGGKGFFDSVGYMLRCIDISMDNKLWIGGGYFLRAFDLDKKTLGPDHYTRIPECFVDFFGADGYHFIRCGPDDNIWISSFECFWKYHPGSGQSQIINPRPWAINGLEWDSLGYAWAGGYGGIARIDPGTGKYVPFEMDTSFFPTEEDRMIFSVNKTSNGKILFQNPFNLFSMEILEDHDPADLHIEKYRFQQVIPQDLISDIIGPGKNNISKPMIDSFDHIWFGTYQQEQGLFHFDPEKHTIRNYSTEHGLSDNRVNTIIMDNSGRIWIGCREGLNCLIPETGEIYCFYEGDGLLSSSFQVSNLTYEGRSQKDEDGNIYMGTSRGVVYFDPDEVIRNINQPGLVFSSLFVNNIEIIPGDRGIMDQTISYTPDLLLKHTDKQVSFQYSVPDFSSDSRRIRYRYKLERFDDKWMDVGDRNYITYSNIPAGNYRLLIDYSKNGQFIGENIISLNIHMSPPPWATWWAYTGYVLFALGAVWGFITWRTREEKHKRREVEKVNARLKEVDQLKDQFLANTSHELRTPLQGIIGLAEALKDGVAGKLPEKAIENLNMINASGKRLANLVNDILDFSKLKKHDLELQVRPVDVRSVVAVVFSVLEPLVKTKKDLELSYAVPEGLPLVEADENRLQQVLHNLLGNAIKFTEKGSVRLTAEAVKGSDDKEMVAIRITDTGIGIPKDKQDNIFQSFEQGEGGISRAYGGTGLGLSITKQLVELQGGTIEVESEPGNGSNFTFTLPLSNEIVGTKEKTWPDPIGQHVGITEQKVIQEEKEEVPEEIKSSPLNGRIDILVVDDEPVNLQVLKNHLTLEGYHVTLANNGVEAMELINKGSKYDLIILDIMMPRLSGYEVCLKLREMYLPSELPVVMLTAKNQVLDLVDGFKTGANDYLTKPFSKDELLSRIKTHLNLQRIHRATGKFVPYEFLRAIGRDSITDVNLGDQVHKEVSILFLDILEYTTLSEKMSPEENFKFINEFVGIMGPVIAENHGFVNQYIGDAIMAIFPEASEDGLMAAIEMQKKLDEFNSERVKEGKKEIRIGIGLHTGPLIMGVIGDQHHAEPTTIADTVNISSRLEGLTRQYGVRIIISESSLKQMKDSKAFNVRYLGQVLVKGKQKPIKMYECVDGDKEDILNLKTNLQQDFDKGLDHFYKKEFPESSVVFNNIIKENVEDHAAAYFYKRAARYALDGVPDDWTGIEKWDVK